MFSRISPGGRWAPLTIIASIHAFACGKPAAPPRPDFEPPYRTDPEDPAILHVRPDLMAKLRFQKAGSDAVQAAVIGYGQIAFAPDASYAVHVPYAAYVSQVLVDLDDEVKRRQPLLELRSSEVARLRAELTNAELELKAETAALARIERLLQDGTATEKEVQQTRARIQVLGATIAGARASFAAAGVEAGHGERFVLRAPAPGRVLARTVAAGERVTPEGAEPALLIGDPKRLVVRAAFPERDAVWLKEGAPCVATVNALGAFRFEGTITRLVRAVDPGTRSAEAICTPRLDDPRISARMLARVEVTVTGQARVIAPRSALLLRRDDYFVFVRVGERRIERRRVEPSLRIGDHVGIERGLQAGDDLVVEGAVLLDGELDQLL